MSERRSPARSARDGGSIGEFVRDRAKHGRLVVQPRMGFGDPSHMRAGLQAVRQCRATAAGTITIDSYTRVGDHAEARRALAAGDDLNGFPLVAHGPRVTAEVIREVAGPSFPVQVRHGSALPSVLVEAMVASGITATEGGPVSYCLPYSKVPLRAAVDDWRVACLSLVAGAGPDAHLETFGGCLLGQLCPPSLLVATSVLEALFFRSHGLSSISLSYAQQIHAGQDVEAVTALRRLAGEFLDGVDRHVVLYSFMGMYPATRRGARALLDDSVRLAVRTSAERLVVKTVAEAYRLPTVAENVAALERADGLAARLRGAPPDDPVWRSSVGPGAEDGVDPGGEVYTEARALIEAVLDLHEDIGEALCRAFGRGLLDVPYCLHPDNRNRARTTIDASGRLRWAELGRLPLPARAVAGGGGGGHGTGSAELLRMLSQVRRRYDEPGLDSEPSSPTTADVTPTGAGTTEARTTDVITEGVS